LRVATILQVQRYTSTKKGERADERRKEIEQKIKDQCMIFMTFKIVAIVYEVHLFL